MVHQISQPSTGHQPVPWNAHLPRPRRVPSRPARGPRCTAPAPQPTPRFHQRCWSIFSQQLWCMSLKKCQIYNQKTIIIGYHRYNMLYMFFSSFSVTRMIQFGGCRTAMGQVLGAIRVSRRWPIQWRFIFRWWIYIYIYMEVSYNGGTPQWMVYKGKSTYKWMAGWWCNNHLEKWWSSSVGRMTSHIWNGK